MKTTDFLLPLFLPLVLLMPTAQAGADWRDIASMEFKLDDYPAADSEDFKKDNEQLLALQKSRTTEQCNQGKRQKWPHYNVLFRTELLDPDQYELAKPLMERVEKFADRVSDYHKGKFDRVRPFNANPQVRPCVEKPGGAKSYPSSHASISAAISCLLADVFTDKADELKAYGKELGDLRAVIGVHYPSDVRAGQKLGQEICERLKAEKDFALELTELKKAAAPTLQIPQ